MAGQGSESVDLREPGGVHPRADAASRRRDGCIHAAGVRRAVRVSDRPYPRLSFRLPQARHLPRDHGRSGESCHPLVRSLLRKLDAGTDSRATGCRRPVNGHGGHRQGAGSELGSDRSDQQLDPWVLPPASPSHRSRAQRRGHRGRALRIVYAGNLGRFQNIPRIAEVMAYFDDDPRVSFDIVGDGPLRPWLRAVRRGERPPQRPLPRLRRPGSTGHHDASGVRRRDRLAAPRGHPERIPEQDAVLPPQRAAGARARRNRQPTHPDPARVRGRTVGGPDQARRGEVRSSRPCWTTRPPWRRWGSGLDRCTKASSAGSDSSAAGATSLPICSALGHDSLLSSTDDPAHHHRRSGPLGHEDPAGRTGRGERGGLRAVRHRVRLAIRE